MNSGNTTLDEALSNFKPYERPPTLRIRKKIEKFVDFLGFQKGKLYFSNETLVWVFGDVENPIWLGDRDLEKSIVIESEPKETFIYLDKVFLKWIDSNDKRTYWLAFIKCIISDKIGYFPIPTNIIGTKLVNEFKNLFIEAKEENLLDDINRK